MKNLFNKFYLIKIHMIFGGERWGNFKYHGVQKSLKKIDHVVNKFLTQFLFQLQVFKLWVKNAQCINKSTIVALYRKGSKLLVIWYFLLYTERDSVLPDEFTAFIFTILNKCEAADIKYRYFHSRLKTTRFYIVCGTERCRIS